ncbi:hypothetical protein DL770_005918 [Monosporascus sp. CRB-9-2]|nr:hypothetical protein DL770_005918 [Monosporascus sp. CRB-9-2]
MFLWGQENPISVETWDDKQIAVIKCKGCVVGMVSRVKSDIREDRQKVAIFSKDALCLSADKRWNSFWTLQASAKSIRKGDVVCLLEGASRPTIIRPYEDYCTVIASVATPSPASNSIRDIGNVLVESEGFLWYDLVRRITARPHKFLLIWDWETTPERGDGDFEAFMSNRIPSHSRTGLEEHAARLRNIGQILGSAGNYEKAAKCLRKALDIHAKAPQTEVLLTLTAMDNLAFMYRSTWYSDTAETLLLDVVQRRKTIQGASHPETIRSLEQLALTYSRRGYGMIGAKKLEGVIDLLKHREEYAQNPTRGAILLTTEILNKELVELLFGPLDRTGKEVTITEDIIKVVAGNERSVNRGVMEFLLNRLDRIGKEIPVTEAVIKAAAGNEGYFKDIMGRHSYGYALPVMELLLDRLDRTGKEVPITGEVIKAAAGNKGWDGPKVMKLLLDRLDRTGKEVPITGKIIKAAAGNKGHKSRDVIKLLLDRLDRTGKDVPITEEIIKAAARNKALSGLKVIKLLLDRLDRTGEEVPITGEIIKAAAGNKGYRSRDVMELLLDRLDRTGKEVPITEEVIKAVAGNEGDGLKVMKLLLNRLDRAGIAKWYIYFRSL